MWNIDKRGFLPKNDPLLITQRITNSKSSWNPEESFYASLDRFMDSVPLLLEERRFREEVVSFLRDCPNSLSDENETLALSTECLEKLFKHYCYLASSYVYALYENKATRLPREIADPLRCLAIRLDREPILSYSVYALNNWRRIDPDEPIVLENLELQQNFSKTNKVDEDWFILIHVDIEARAAEGISALNEYKESFYRNNPPRTIEACDKYVYASYLRRMHASLRMMNITMNRMPEQCSEDFYFTAVRPFIFGFENVNYESKRENREFTLRGETGAQSSIVPAYVAALQVDHTDSILTKHLTEMRRYMPKEHRVFVKDLEVLNVSGQAGTIRAVSERSKDCAELYNSCLEELLAFRTKHLEFAINYIQKRVDNPLGTGGTPFIPWLTQLRDETESRYIKTENMS